MLLDKLPEDALVEIFTHLDIWDIFACRLTCRALRSACDSGIGAIARQVSLNTFPQDRLISRKPANGGRCNFEWLKDRIPTKLSSTLLDDGEHMIPAEADWGEPARTRVSRGWKALRRIAETYREVYRIPAYSLPLPSSEDSSWYRPQWSEISNKRLRRDLGIVRRREALAISRCTALIASLSKDECYGFMLLWDRLVCGPFRSTGSDDRYHLTRAHTFCNGRIACVCPGWCYPPDDQQQDRLRRNLPRDWYGRPTPYHTLEAGSCWTTWFLLRHGPRPFLHQWCTRRGDFLIESHILKKWRCRSKEQIELERVAASQIWYAVALRAWGQDPLANKHLQDSLLLRPEYLWWGDSAAGLGPESGSGVDMPPRWYHGNDWGELYQLNGGTRLLKSQVAWVLWQDGVIGMDEEFEVSKYCSSLHDTFDMHDWFLKIRERGRRDGFQFEIELKKPEINGKKKTQNARSWTRGKMYDVFDKHPKLEAVIHRTLLLPVDDLCAWWKWKRTNLRGGMERKNPGWVKVGGGH